MASDKSAPDHKDTLNLPQTSFPMKAGLPQREPQLLSFWQDMDIYEKLRQQSAGRPKYILHDGPPYANGRIHMGHALNKILKDLILKSKQMNGFNVVYVPGWDCHGLPIEHEVDKKLGSKKRDMTKAQIRQECRRYADKFLDIQREEFIRLGIFGDWFHPYITMDYDFEAITAGELAEFFRRGSVYRSKKPIYWCNSCRTALAEAEVEYDDHTSPSVYVAFPITSDLSDLAPALAGVPVSAVIWTTTPWTLPANLAIALNPDYAYGVYAHNGQGYLMAEELAEANLQLFNMPDAKKIAGLDPQKLEGRQARHPFYDRPSLLTLADYVTLDSGTGLVHTAPGHGREDYETGLRYGLEVYSPLDDGGRYLPEVELFAGQEVFAANENIIAKMKENGSLLAAAEMSHSYPHCWRCKRPVIFRATPQWFISMEANQLREKALSAIKNDVSWVPRWGQDRIYSMIENRPDWCISRQRSWGVPIIILQCEDCHEPVLTPAMAEKIVSAFRREGADAWFNHSVEELLGSDCQCDKCGSNKLYKGEDILDVWFDSGTSQAAVLAARPELTWPADLYLEGSDQHRGWFHSSLLCAVGARDHAPYRAVLTHGFVVDGNGRKMSKSVGNVIQPQDLIKRYGVDILRLWVAAEDYTNDIRLSEQHMKQLSEAYRRIRNTMRFLLGNLYDFDPARDMLDYEQLGEMDRYMLHRLEEIKTKAAKAYDDFTFHVIYHSLHNFCSVDLSGFYMDVSKDCLYTSGKTSRRRRAVQSVLYEMLHTMVRLLAPVLSFTAEEVWQYLPGEKQASVHMAGFAPARPQWLNQELAAKWEKLLEIRGEVNKGLDLARKEKIVGNSLDAKLSITADRQLHEFIAANLESLAEICMVSQIELAEQPLAGEMGLTITPSAWPKCPRCWKRRPESAGEQLCHECRQAVE